MSFLYMTPFQKRPQPPEPKTYIRALARQKWSKPDLPYELDIWDSKKVLNVQWDDAGNVQLGSFRPGGWEKRLLAHHQTNGELALHPRCM